MPRGGDLGDLLHSVGLPADALAADGLKAWENALERDYEGLVAKDPESPYRGGRTFAWLKVKQLRGGTPAAASAPLVGGDSSIRACDRDET